MAKSQIIGREYEQHILEMIYNDEDARLVAVYGRRRVGKTFLLKNFFDEKLDFYFTGSFQAKTKIQLALFNNTLSEAAEKQYPMPKDWFEAFSQLKDFLSNRKQKRMVVFLDELPWIDTPKSNFLTAFSFWWNSWASSCKGLKVIICGSATSWMLEKIIGDKGGLYGRSSRSIYLAPFNLYEVEQFLKKKKGIVWNRYQILEAYMILGGIPYYLDMLERNLPFEKNIDNLFFGEDAPLRREYDFLFRSLFKSSGVYRQVVESVAKKGKGLTLQEIKAELGVDDGGSLTKVLTNLCNCDFVRKYAVYGKKNKGALYQLTDLFSLFHLKFVSSRTGIDRNYWSNLSESKRNSWAGFAFERVCLHHIDQIRHKLSIKGVLTNVCSWNSPRQVDRDGTEWGGAQIDLILSRNDHVSDICEMKYTQSLFVVTRVYEERLRERNATFVHLTQTRDAIHNILVTTYGLKKNNHSGIFYDTITADDLFHQ